MSLLFPLLSFAQQFDATPRAVGQGEVLHITSPAAAASARLGDRTIRLFPQSDGTRLGLMPVEIEAKPGKMPLEFLDAQGRVVHAGQVTIRRVRYREQNIALGKQQVELKPAPGEMETVRALRQTVTDQRFWREPLTPPLPGCMISPYGVKRLHNGKPTGNYHTGLDQRGAEGAPIHAVAAGVVRVVRMFNVHGGTVGIDHGQGVTSIYLHQSRFAVHEGATVKAGDVIGYVGSTGRSSAPHLHWNLQVNGLAVNPLQWMSIPPCGAAPPARAKKAGSKR